MDRTADAIARTMTIDAIEALPIRATDDAVLFVWGPCRCCLTNTWGFTDRSMGSWVKERDGTRDWFSNRLYLLLVDTRDNIRASSMGDQPVSQA